MLVACYGENPHPVSLVPYRTGQAGPLQLGFSCLVEALDSGHALLPAQVCQPSLCFHFGALSLAFFLSKCPS